MGPNGPLFTSLASRDITPRIAPKLPAAITLPTSTGGTFTASTTSIVPTNTHASHISVSGAGRRTLADVSRERRRFDRKRNDFSDDRLGKLCSTRWLDWGCYAAFAPEWDDGGVGGGYGAEVVLLDWAYKKSRREKQMRKLGQQMEKMDAEKTDGMQGMEGVDETIDEKLVLQWEPPRIPEDLTTTTSTEEVESKEEDDGKEMSVDETLEGLRTMIGLLSQMQTLRMAQAKSEIPEDELALGIPQFPSPHYPPSILSPQPVPPFLFSYTPPCLCIRLTFLATTIITSLQSLILTHSITPSALQSSLPKDSYSILSLTHPSYTGSLPAKPLPQWQPPNPLPAGPPPHLNRGINTHHHHHQQYQLQQQQQQQQQRQIHAVPPQQQQRLLPGTPAGYQNRGTPVQQGGMIGRYPGTPGTPLTPVGGYPSPAAGGYNLQGSTRGVGRPRKYAY